MGSQREQEAGAAGRPSGMWYFVSTWLSCGLLAAVPFFHAASVLRRPSLRRVGAVYLAATLLSFTMVGVAPVDAEGTPTGWFGTLSVVTWFAVVLAATLQQIGLRQEVYGDRGASPAGASNLTAMERVEQARSKRREARALAQRDPLMARELRIGRPDLPRDYDDGGLVDLNAVDAQVIAGVCQIPMQTAERLVATRAELGGFSSVEEAIVYTDVSGDWSSGLRERGIVLVPRIGDL